MKIKKYLEVLAILAIGFLTMAFTPQLKEMLDKATQRIMSLEVENLQLKIKITSLSVEVSKLSAERKEDKYVLYTTDMLTRGAVPSRWANPSHISYVISVCKKYEYIVTDIKKNEPLACWQFVMARCMATGLDPNFHCDKDGNGKWDSGIADLNDVCLESLQKDLPEHLKRRNWYNIEKSIAGLYVWIKQRNRHMPWAELSFPQWQYYAKIKEGADETISK